MSRLIRPFLFVCCCGLPACGSPIFSGTGPDRNCSNYSWAAVPDTCGGCAGYMDLIVDRSASPPQARLQAGERTFIKLVAINRAPAGCLDTQQIAIPSFSGWVSSDPSVASLEGFLGGSRVTVRAASAGDALIFADSVYTPSGPIRAQLAYCPATNQDAACVPINLVLRVVP